MQEKIQIIEPWKPSRGSQDLWWDTVRLTDNKATFFSNFLLAQTFIKKKIKGFHLISMKYHYFHFIEKQVESQTLALMWPTSSHQACY